jgi:hypothetical protein
MKYPTLPKELRNLLDPPEPRPSINPRGRRTRDPAMPYDDAERVTISIQFPGWLANQIRLQAQKGDRSINGQVRLMLLDWFERHGTKIAGSQEGEEQ